MKDMNDLHRTGVDLKKLGDEAVPYKANGKALVPSGDAFTPVSYTHLRAHET